mmetsp:Transcript_22813/g.70882  ORF Transcript_22813/g.70882 Transcript_22813/m.70882 type:complete len:240 (+) Transcript_22813:259-978(+)
MPGFHPPLRCSPPRIRPPRVEWGGGAPSCHRHVADPARPRRRRGRAGAAGPGRRGVFDLLRHHVGAPLRSPPGARGPVCRARIRRRARSRRDGPGRGRSRRGRVGGPRIPKRSPRGRPVPSGAGAGRAGACAQGADHVPRGGLAPGHCSDRGRGRPGEAVVPGDGRLALHPGAARGAFTPPLRLTGAGRGRVRGPHGSRLPQRICQGIRPRLGLPLAGRKAFTYATCQGCTPLTFKGWG